MAKWSGVWTDHKGTPGTPRGCSSVILRELLLEELRITPPAKPKKKTGGKYPHLQPFFRNRKQEEKAA